VTSTVPTAAATTVRKADVVVVLNASDRDHFAVSGPATYRAAEPEWASLSFVADDDIGDALVPRLEDGDVDLVVFASNALMGAAAQRAIAEKRFTRLWADDDDAPSRDVGVIVMHQYLPRDSRLKLGFLGGAEFSLVGQEPRRLDNADLRSDDAWPFVDEIGQGERAKRFLRLSTGYGAKHHCIWTRFEFEHRDQWERIAWENRREPLIAACRAGRRVVIGCRVPIDWTGEHELIRAMIATALRPRGCLVVEAPTTTGASAFSTALASAIDRHRFVYGVRPEKPEQIDPTGSPYRYFDELIVAPEWRVDEIPALDQRAVLRKLEQGGAVVATFKGPGARPVAVRLSGQPQYAARATELAAWIVARLPQFQGDIWAMRGLAAAIAAAERAYVDRRLIPPALRRDFVHRHLGRELAARLADGNVDENVLATAGTYFALRVMTRARIPEVEAWLQEHVDGELPSVLAQALALVPELESESRLERLRSAAERTATGEDPLLLNAYLAVLFAKEEPERVSAAAADETLGLGVQAELLLAVARHGITDTDAVVRLGTHVREQIARLAERGEALEAVCIGNAALIELARGQGIAPNVAVRGRPREDDVRTLERTELAKQHATALEDAKNARQAANVAVVAVTAVLVLITALAVLAILVWFQAGVDGKFGFATGVVGFMAPIIFWVVRRAQQAGVWGWPTRGGGT
jgi:hypothetical protein